VERAAVLLVALLAGCSLGEESASIERSELGRLVLQPGDLPRTFVRIDDGRQNTADSPGGRRADPSRFDRIEGWRARYHRPGTAQTAGPVVIESRADLFESADGAEEDLEAARADLGENEPEWKPIDEPGLGDESFAATSVGGGVRYFLVLWRQSNATATLNVNGFDRKLALAEVLELARRQEDRLSRAADS
jgi:hypothetical protein